MRPLAVHTHLVHADAYGQMAGLLAGVPLRLSTKHGFNEFRESRFFAVADRAVAWLAHVHIAISHGLARYLARDGGLRRAELRDRPLRDPPEGGAAARAASRRACSASAG